MASPTTSHTDTHDHDTDHDSLPTPYSADDLAAAATHLLADMNASLGKHTCFPYHADLSRVLHDSAQIMQRSRKSLQQALRMVAPQPLCDAAIQCFDRILASWDYNPAKRARTALISDLEMVAKELTAGVKIAHCDKHTWSVYAHGRCLGSIRCTDEHSWTYVVAGEHMGSYPCPQQAAVTLVAAWREPVTLRTAVVATSRCTVTADDHHVGCTWHTIPAQVTSACPTPDHTRRS